jgi:hypothetical protein
MATRAAINHTGVSFRLPLHHHLHQQLQKLERKNCCFKQSLFSKMSEEELRVPFLRSEEPTSFEGSRKEMTAQNVRNFFPVVEQKVGKPRYKLVTFFHCAFKLTSFILYLVSNIMGKHFSQLVISNVFKMYYILRIVSFFSGINI